MARRLREPEAGIHHERLARNAELLRTCCGTLPVGEHIGNDVVVGRERPLAEAGHRLLRRARVREDERRAAPGSDARELGISEQRHVVDGVRAGIETGRGDAWARRVDRDARALCSPADEVEHAAELLFGGHRPAAGLRGLTTDVDDVRALRDEGFDARPSTIPIEKVTAVAERVRRHVADAHDRHTTAANG